MSEYTAEQIEEAIRRALQAQDVTAVVPLLKLLAVRDPERAQLLLDTIQAGIAISRTGPRPMDTITVTGDLL